MIFMSQYKKFLRRKMRDYSVIDINIIFKKRL